MKFPRPILYGILAILWLASSAPASAKTAYAFRLGPPSVGQGGPNPVTFSAVEYQLQYLHTNSLEANVSFTGFFLGKRHTFANQAYVSAGGGLALSANGSGFGVYTAFGADFFCGINLCMSAEYTKALGIVDSNIVSPYAVRIGASLWL